MKPKDFSIVQLSFMDQPLDPNNQAHGNIYPQLPPPNVPYGQPYPYGAPYGAPYGNPIPQQGMPPQNPQMQLGAYPNYNAGQVGVGRDINEEQRMLNARICALDYRLNNGCLYCYYIWLIIVLIMGCIGFIANLITLQLSIVGSIWVILECYFGIMAISNKNLSNAKTAYVMIALNVTLSALIAVLLPIVCLIAGISLNDNYYTECGEVWNGSKYTYKCVPVYFTPLGVSVAVLLVSLIFSVIFQILTMLVGIVKVKNILAERQALTNQFAFAATANRA